jgi:hypothetical protein
MATRTPLLVVTDAGEVQLCGPDGIVTDLRRVGTRSANRAAPAC